MMATRSAAFDPLVESTAGIADHLRLLLPREKVDLILGSPDHADGERSTIRLATLLARDAGVFIDVGANEGVFTFSVASRSDRPIDLHLFEPDPVLHDRLRDNLARNKIKARLNQSAVGEVGGVQTFYRNLDDDTSGSLTTHFAQKHKTASIDVNVRTLAGYLAERDIVRACVKIDVEGAGVAAWNGAAFGLDRIKWLIIEIIGPEAEARLVDRILAESKWNGFYIADFDLIRVDLGDYPVQSPYYNWLFTAAPVSELASLLRGTKFKIVDLERP